jgi:hypothetical protein
MGVWFVVAVGAVFVWSIGLFLFAVAVEVSVVGVVMLRPTVTSQIRH